MDWKNDRTEAVCNISAYYSTNYVFTYIHMPEESFCTLKMQNLKKKKKSQQQRAPLFMALLLSS